MSAVTCPGDCCEAISLPPEAVRRLEERPESVEDGVQVSAMLVPLPPAEAREIVERNGGRFNAELRWFTCTNWDPATRLCKVYEARPGMCSAYPYGRGCDFGCGCQGTPRGRARDA